jgi:hypothetical protein
MCLYSLNVWCDNFQNSLALSLAMLCVIVFEVEKMSELISGRQGRGEVCVILNVSECCFDSFGCAVRLRSGDYDKRNFRRAYQAMIFGN